MMLDKLIIPEFEQMMTNIDSADSYVCQLFDIYHQRLLENDDVCKRLEHHHIDMKMIANCQLGFCDRKLNRYINASDTIDGAAFRGALQRLELIKSTGHELFRGCITEPIFNDDNQIIAACGVKLICPGRPAPRIIQWFRYKTYPHPIYFNIMIWGKRYVH